MTEQQSDQIDLTRMMRCPSYDYMTLRQCGLNHSEARYHCRNCALRPKVAAGEVETVSSHDFLRGSRPGEPDAQPSRATPRTARTAEEIILEYLATRTGASTQELTAILRHLSVKSVRVRLDEMQQDGKILSRDVNGLTLWSRPDGPKRTNGRAPSKRQVDVVLEWLQANPGEHSKADVVKGTSLESQSTSNYLYHLVRDGKIKRTGWRGQYRYSAVPVGPVHEVETSSAPKQEISSGSAASVETEVQPQQEPKQAADCQQEQPHDEDDVPVLRGGGVDRQRGVEVGEPGAAPVPAEEDVGLDEPQQQHEPDERGIEPPPPPINPRTRRDPYAEHDANLPGPLQQDERPKPGDLVVRRGSLAQLSSGLEGLLAEVGHARVEAELRRDILNALPEPSADWPEPLQRLWMRVWLAVQGESHG